MPLRILHRSSAFLLFAFICVHVINHLVVVFGIQAHIDFMEIARIVYRTPIVEGLLLFCAAFQVASGLWLVTNSWRDLRGVVAWLQVLSGLYIAFFLLIHVTAVLVGRAILGLDTNFYFAAAGIHVPPNQWFFVPYYFLSLIALSAHIGCAIYWFLQDSNQMTRKTAVILSILLGSIASAVIVLSLAGKLYRVDIPAKYIAPYQRAP